MTWPMIALLVSTVGQSGGCRLMPDGSMSCSGSIGYQPSSVSYAGLGSYFGYPSARIPAIEVVQVDPGPTYNWHKTTTDDGLNFQVWGYIVAKPDGSRVVSWNPSLKQNADNREAAAKARTKAALEHGVQPSPPAPAPPEPEKPKAAEQARDPKNTAKQDEKPTDTHLSLAQKGNNFGVDASKMKGHGYTIDGHQASTSYVEDSLKKPLEGRSFITVIGTKEEQGRVKEDWENNPELKQFRDLAWFVGFTPDEWQVAGDLGFAGKSEGHPTVIVQQADGVVVGRDDSYTGASNLAQTLRKAHPRYNPESDPPLGSARAISWSPNTLRLIAVVLLVVIVAAIVIPNRR